MTYLAARPAVGKTAFVLEHAQNVGTKQNKAVAVFFIRDGCRSLVDRMLQPKGYRFSLFTYRSIRQSKIEYVMSIIDDKILV